MEFLLLRPFWHRTRSFPDAPNGFFQHSLPPLAEQHVLEEEEEDYLQQDDPLLYTGVKFHLVFLSELEQIELCTALS